MQRRANGRLSRPYHLQLRAGRQQGQVLSVREHLLPGDEDPALPLVVLTFHPGYAAGSYGQRDYFELLAPLLFARCQGCCRLHIFTINHPGYDLPQDYKVDRFSLTPYAIDDQPALIRQVLRWFVLREFAEEEDIFLLPYGHSMGGLALARADLGDLAPALARQGRRLRVQKVLSAPAMALQPQARDNLGRLTALEVIKRTVGRVPLYDRVAQSLFRNIAPLLYRRDAENYALNPDCSFLDFGRYNPYVLLEQGRQLLQVAYDEAQLADLLHGAHLILSAEDGMVDSEMLARAAAWANEGGTAVPVHTIPSSHNAERDDPHLIGSYLCDVLQTLA